MRTRCLADRTMRGLLFLCALVWVLIVFLIGLFILREGWPALSRVGPGALLAGREWRPQNGQFGLLPMIAGSLLATLGSLALGVPLAIACAALLAEVAPASVRAVVRPAVELLAGIPSVIYGLFGLSVLVPLIRRIPAPRNSGLGLLAASIVLAVMILPTITNIAEDAIRAVPRDYKEGSLALGATHWQTITGVILPGARSGLVTAVILGVGRALGETMAVTMVIGNSVIIPRPLDGNPLSIFLSQARTLTGSIVVEVSYASGLHASALFATGIVLLVLTVLINSLAHAAMKGGAQ